MSESMPPQSGRVIAGKYRVDAQLGEGAMGTVWAATHINLGQRVAVKLICPELAESEHARFRFDAEAKAAAALRSRFVVHIYDSGITEDGMPYLVMEYLTGESLEERVERGGPLALDYAVQVLAQVGRGLARAHAMKIVHRDLKPANVFLVQTEDGEEVAKILDFGVAKVRREGPSQSATATGAVVGTPLFMSPEQARGLKTVDHRSDLYSLGMMAFWMLTGEHAFEGEAFGDLILAICTQPLPHIHHVAPWVPAELDEWFQKACAREPEDRFESSEELIGALVAAAKVAQAQVDAVGGLTQMVGTDARFALPSYSGLADEPGDVPVPLVQPGAADTVLAHATSAGGSRPASGRNWLLRPSTGVIVGVALVILFVGGAVIAALTRGTAGGLPEAAAPTPAERPAAAQPEPPAPAAAAESAGPESDSPAESEPTAVPSARPSATASEPAPVARELPRSAPMQPATAAHRPPPRTLPVRPSNTGEIDIGF